MKFYLLFAIILVITGLIVAVAWKNKPTSPSNTNSALTQNQNQSSPQKSPQTVAPIADAVNRITKKPFGLYVTPQNSPVQPERFTGFHSGTDFETTTAEQNTDVPFYAICAGKILAKRFASGYGGVLVQSCTINSQAVTIVYGHVSLTSIKKNIGDDLAQEEKIGSLGHSPDETDGERKHLHLGIHLGTDINIKGYVNEQSDLSGWLDFEKLR